MTEKDKLIFEAEMMQVQRSTGTRFPVFLRVHNWLRMHVPWYYWWHVHRASQGVHVLILLAYLVVSPYVMYGYLMRNPASAEGPVTTVQADGSLLTTQTELDNPHDNIVALKQEQLGRAHPEVSTGFTDLSVTLESSSSLIDSARVKEKLMVDKKDKSGVSNYALDTGLTIETKYEPSKARSVSSGNPVKQTITVTNPTTKGLTTDVTIRQEIPNEKVMWDGKEYTAKTIPQILKPYQGEAVVNPRTKAFDEKLKALPRHEREGLPEVKVPVTMGTTIEFKVGDKTATYDFSDLMAFNPTVEVSKIGSETILVVRLASVTVAPKSTLVLDPTYDLATTSTFNARFDGPQTNGSFDYPTLDTEDIDNDGYPDIIVSASAFNHSGIIGGAVYVIFHGLLATKNGVGNTIDLADTNNFNIRYQGSGAFEVITDHSAAFMADLNNNHKADLLIPSSDIAGYYVIEDSLMTPYATSTGHVVDLGISSNYTFKMTQTSDFGLGLYSTGTTADLDGDGKNDLLLGDELCGHGCLYVLYNPLFGGISGTGTTLDLANPANFNLRIEGAAADDLIYGDSYTRTYTTANLDSDGKPDIIVGGEGSSQNGRSASGSDYVLFSNLLSNYLGTGNIIDLANPNNWNLRFDGGASSDLLGNLAWAGDIVGDNKPDLILAAPGRNSQSGSVYIISNSIISSFSGTGHALDMATISNWTIRLDGSSGATFGYGDMQTVDYDNDGQSDLLVGSADGFKQNSSGSLYVIYDSLLRNTTGTGNTLDMASTSNYSLRYDGAVASDQFSDSLMVVSDLNGDGTMDIIDSARGTDYNSRSNSGSAYVIFNFPHSVTLTNPPSSTSSGDVTLSGAISASNSVTTVSNVQYRLDSNSPSGSWNNCSAGDGTYDSRSESFSCSVNLGNTGNHTVYIRAKDSNGVYTAQSHYTSQAISYNVAASPTPTPAADTTPPALSLRTIGNGTFRPTTTVFTYYSATPKPLFGGASESGATITIKEGSNTICTTTTKSDGTWSCKSATVLPFGRYTISVSAVDASGNTATLKSFTLITTAPEANQPEDTGVVTEETPLETPVALSSPSPLSTPVTIAGANEINTLAMFTAPVAKLASSPITGTTLAAAALGASVFPFLAAAGTSSPIPSTSSGGAHILMWWQRRKNHGKVASSLTGKPVSGAVVTLFDSLAYNRKIGETVTDHSGRFGFLVKPGTYTLQVKHAEYTYPSVALVYRGEAITMEKEGVIDQEILIDPVNTKKALIGTFEIMSIVFAFLRLPLLIIGTILALISFLSVVSLFGGLGLLYYSLLWVWEVIELKQGHGLLTVTNAEGKAVPLATVRLKDSLGRLILTRMTSNFGHVLLMVPEGTYSLEIIPSGASGLAAATQNLTIKPTSHWRKIGIQLEAKPSELSPPTSEA